MNVEDRIRLRAFFLCENDRSRTTVRELDDWLEAERLELACSLAAIGNEVALAKAGRTTFDQDDVWYSADDVAKMMKALKPRLRNRRKGSVLLQMLESYQDYLTNSTPVSDAAAVEQGTNALHVYHLTLAFDALLGAGNVANHSLSKELKDLFSEDKTSFETSEFNIVSAGRIQNASGLTVTFIDEGDDLSPDLRVGDLAYVECKDLHPASRAGLEKSLADNLDKAIDQLNTAQATNPLMGTGICVDVPQGMLPLSSTEWQVLRDALARTDGPTFILVSCSGIRATNDEVSFPVEVALATKPAVPQELHIRLLCHLAKKSFRLAQPVGFDEIVH